MIWLGKWKREFSRQLTRETNVPQRRRPSFFVRSGISLSNREKKVKKGNYCHFYRLKQRRLIGVWRSKVEFKISFSFITSIMWRCFFVFFYLLLLLLILFLFPTDSIGIINIWLIFFPSDYYFLYSHPTINRSRILIFPFLLGIPTSYFRCLSLISRSKNLRSLNPNLWRRRQKKS